MKGQVWGGEKKSGFKRGVVFSQGFVHLEIWREKFQKQGGLQKSCDPLLEIHLHKDMEEKVSEKWF